MTLFKSKIVGGIAVGGALLALVVILNGISLRYPEGIFDQRQIQAAWDAIDTAEGATIGGSTAGGISFVALGQSGALLHGSSRDVFETEAILKLMLPRAKNLETVYFTVDPVMLVSDNRYSNAKKRRIIYQALSAFEPSALISDDWRNAFIANYLPLIRSDNWRSALISIVTFRKAEAPKALTIEKPINAVENEKLIRSAIPIRARLYTDNVRTVIYRHPEVPERVEQAVLRIQELAAGSGARLVLFEPPVTAAYSEEMADITAEYRPRFDRLMALCQERGVLVADFRDDPEFTTNYALFRDANHLNAEGAVLFSAKLRDWIQAESSRVSE